MNSARTASTRYDIEHVQYLYVCRYLQNSHRALRVSEPREQHVKFWQQPAPFSPFGRTRTAQVTGSATFCPQCGLVAYCSEACATAALRAWHGGECLDPSSGACLETNMSGMSPECRVALRALRRVGQQEGPPPTKRESKDVTRPASLCGAASSRTRLATCPDRPSSPASSPGSYGGCDAAWPRVELRHLQEHYTARSTQERESLETEAAIAAVLARGGDGGAGSHAESDGASAKAAGQEVHGLLAMELVTTLVKVR